MVIIYIVKYYYNETIYFSIYFENVIYSCHGKADFLRFQKYNNLKMTFYQCWLFSGFIDE